MPRPRLAFVGLGWIGRMRLDSIAAGRTAEVAALCEPDPERLADVGARHPLAARFASLGALLAASDDLELDGVVLATPNAAHADGCVAALGRGLAVFCQKPLALSAADARRVVDAARDADRLLGVDWTYRGLRSGEELVRLATAGELGRVFHVDAVFHNAYGPDKPWCFDPAVAGGGAFVDLGVHLVDLALAALGDGGAAGDRRAGGAPRVAGALYREGRRFTGPGIDDFAVAHLALAGGASADVAASWHAHAGQDCVVRVAVFGSTGGAELRNVGGSFYDFELALHRGRSTAVVAQDAGADGLARATLAWVERLAAGARFDPAIAAVVDVTHAVESLYREPDASRTDVAEPPPAAVAPEAAPAADAHAA